MTITQNVPQVKGHVVAFALPLWGHVKPLCALLAKIIRLKRVNATLFTSDMILNKVQDEVARQFLPEGEEHLRKLIRVVGLPAPTVPFQYDAYNQAFVEGYRVLYSGNPVAVSTDSNATHEAIAPPQAVIIDFFCYAAMKGVRSISGSDVPIYAWQSGAAIAILFLFGPESIGGNGDLAAKLAAITDEDPEERDIKMIKIHRRTDEGLINMPGIPPMYAHEHSPQIVSLPVNPTQLALFMQYVHRMFSESDGVINSTHRLYEGAALEKWQEWYGSKPVIAVGPLSPPSSEAEIIKETQGESGREVEAFLNKAFDKYGPKSVIFISFGTVWWSSEPEKVWTILDVLMEQGIPFIFGHAAPHATVPEAIKAKVKASGLGYMASWIPQQMILRHAACGWFMSHCGHNSTMESLTAGVPLICWPYDADQPSNAANVTLVHNAGYELLSVRNGQGLRPLHRLGGKSPDGSLEAVRAEAIDVLTKARGKDGEAKRMKAQWFSEVFARSWAVGGEAWEELGKFTDILHG